MKTIVDCLERHLERIPEKVFCHFVQDGTESPITFRELLNRAGRYASCYRKHGLVAGDSVLIVLSHSPDILYAFVGAILGGFVPSILAFPSPKQDARLYWHSYEQLVRRIGSRALVTYAANLPAVRSAVAADAGLQVLLPEDVNQVFASDTVIANVNPESIAFLQHTSGTTGLKKGIALSHRAVLLQCDSYRATLRLAEHDLIASWLPLYHDMGLIACFIMPLLMGTPVVWMDPFEWVYRPEMLFEAIERHAATLVWLPNFSLNHLAATVDESAKYDLSSVRAFINCSEPCKPASARIFVDTFERMNVVSAKMHTCYAMAETVFAVTQSDLHSPVRRLTVDRETLRGANRAIEVPPSEDAIEMLSVGRPIPNIQVRVVGESRSQLNDGQVGEIAVSSPFLFSGYYRLPDETNSVCADNWYYTGDLGFIYDGELYITGRKKDILIVNGRNYYAHDIESVVSQVPLVKRGRCVALGITNDVVGSEEIVVIAETAANDEDARRQIVLEVRRRILDTLNLHVRDVLLVPLGWIVKTTSGKMDRTENKKKYLAFLHSAGEREPRKAA